MDGDGAAALDLHLAHLPAAARNGDGWAKAADFDPGGKADAGHCSALTGSLLALTFANCRVAGDSQRLIEGLVVISAVVGEAGGCIEWKLIRSGKVLTSQ